MESAFDPKQPHSGHPLSGPHFGARLTPEQCAIVQRWLEETHENPEIGVREHALFLAEYPQLEAAVRRRAKAALLGGFEPSSPTHAVAMLGVRLTRQLIRSIAETPPTSSKPIAST